MIGILILYFYNLFNAFSISKLILAIQWVPMCVLNRLYMYTASSCKSADDKNYKRYAQDSNAGQNYGARRVFFDVCINGIQK